MKRPVAATSAGGSALVRVEVPKLLTKFQQIAELLIQPAWEDESAKGDRCLMAFVSTTLVKLLVKVEHPPLKLMVSGRGWDEAWAALEAVLRSDDIPWEQDAPRDGGGGRKKK